MTFFETFWRISRVLVGLFLTINVIYQMNSKNMEHALISLALLIILGTIVEIDAKKK